jgi:hypothetical protein
MSTKIEEYKTQLNLMAAAAAEDAVLQAQARVAAKLQVDQADYQLAADAIIQQFTQEMIDKLNLLVPPAEPTPPVATP